MPPKKKYVLTCMIPSLLALAAGTTPVRQTIEKNLHTPEHAHPQPAKHSCCAPMPASQPAPVVSLTIASVASLSKSYPEKVIDTVIYECSVQPAKNTSSTGDVLPYTYIRGQYRKKGELHWNTFLVYFRNPHTRYKTIECITNNWRIEDGRTHWPEHELPDGLPDLIESENPSYSLRMYHQCALPCTAQKHEWLVIPECDQQTQEKHISHAQSTLCTILAIIDKK